MTPRGRFAPSPTGEIHLGNASTALLAWLSIRAASGTFVMRVEDLDTARVRPGLAQRILDDLAWLGLDWDEGGGRGGPHEPYDQSHRTARHEAAFDLLHRRGRLYPCFCSRRDIAMAATAPQEPGDERRYPGTCRDLDAPDFDRRHAWRLRVDPETRPVFEDRVHGVWGRAESRAPGDFVVRRSDGIFAYHLAVVVDDADMAIDEVVRGDDLLASTSRQLLVQDALGLERPSYGHVPLLLGPDGVRLSKRHQGTTLRELREAGLSAERIVGRLAALHGLRPRPDPVRARDLIDGFDLSRIRPVSPGIVVDPAAWG